MLFNRNNLISYFFDSKKQEIQQEIENLEDKYILGINDEEYNDYLYNQFLIEEVKLDFENAISLDDGERIVSGQNIFGHAYETKKPVIKFMIPAFGNYELLTYCPSSSVYSSGLFLDKNIALDSNYLSFEIISYSDDNVENVNNEYNRFENIVQNNTGSLNREISGFNKNLKPYITGTFKNRKDVLLKRQKAFTGLKVPLKQNVNMSETFSIPFSKPRKRIEMPKVSENNKYEISPTLNFENYEQILKIINDCGKEFERLNKTYKSFQEEDFRNNILFNINTNFDGVATGETFNAGGKTDILLRYDNSIIFIAECKIWSGISDFKKAINQLINYLTWRDTKTALIIFVKKEDIVQVIKTIKAQISEHLKFKEYICENDKSWINYEFYLNVEKTIVFNLAVMIYKV